MKTQVPGRWQLDALAEQVRALNAAECELAMSLKILDDPALTGEALAQALDRYMLALIERNALRDGRP